MKFLKYEFTTKKWAELKPQLTDNLINSVVEIGFVIKSKEGDNIILSDKYSVDILWENEELSSFAKFKIWIEGIGTHSFGESIDKLYIDAYNAQK